MKTDLQSAVLIVSAIAVTSAVVAVGKFFLEGGTTVLEPVDQRLGSLVGTFAVFIVGGLLPGSLAWTLLRDQDDEETQNWLHDLRDAALCNAIATIPGFLLLYLLVWDPVRAALLAGSLALIGTGTFVAAHSLARRLGLRSQQPDWSELEHRI
ncbi:hypothetical protein ACI7YT_09035 [Microbacterium sp. M]|uniref:hypothetical protein n=1 Tax=Microbacterium sp. M TaxID=3377125 RepID=UPI0038678BAA